MTAPDDRHPDHDHPDDHHTAPHPDPATDPAADRDIDDELAAGDGTLSETLRTLLRAPEDFEERVADTVSDQLVGTSSSAIALDLLGLGARTLTFFLSTRPPAADRSDGAPGLPGTGRRDRR